MLSNILKKTIIFFIPFLIINNIYADEGLSLNYNYKTNDAEYIVTIKYSHLGYIEEQTVTKMDSDGVSKPVSVTPLKDILNKGELIYKNGYLFVNPNMIYVMNEILVKLIWYW